MGTTRHDPESLPWLILQRIIGIIIFLIVVIVLDLLAGTTGIAPVRIIATFLIDNFWLIIFFSLIFLFADIFAALPFPINIPAPFLNAAGAVLLVEFLVRIFLLADEVTGVAFFGFLAGFAPFLEALVFLVVLVAGIADIIRPRRTP
jgi:hypothetical protein